MRKTYQAVILGLLMLAAAAALAWWWPFGWPRLLGAGAAVAVVFMAFGCGYVDSALGMGYGVTLTPILILLGYPPLDVVPAMVVSQFVLGAVGAVAHHSVGNANFRPGTRDFWVTAALVVASVGGAVAGARLALHLPKTALTAWIGALVLLVGVATLATFGRHMRFSWPKIVGLGLFAGFNKGTTGGGYGPVITGGQLLCGVPAANAVAITTLAETVTCIAGALAFLGGDAHIRWNLVPFLTAGAVAAVPFSALTVRVLKPAVLKIAVGVLAFVLGVIVLLKLFVF